MVINIKYPKIFTIVIIPLMLWFVSCDDEKAKDEYELMYNEAISISNAELAAKKFPKLSKGNVQLSKWIYMFQCFIYPKYDNGTIPYPENYTGNWYRWNSKGVLTAVNSVVNGKRHGRLVAWDDNGAILYEKYYENDKQHGFLKDFHDNGQLFSVCKAVSGKVVGIQKRFSKDGSLLYCYFWDGKGTREKNTIQIYGFPDGNESQEKIDLQPQYAKEIAAFERELKAFEKEHGVASQNSSEFKTGIGYETKKEK